MSDIRFNRWLHQSGTGGVFQDSSGNVGIGSSVPRSALDIVGVINVTGNINSTGVTTVTSLRIGTGTSISSPSSNTLTLGTNNAERVRVDSSGNLGIGLTNPASKLSVFDNFSATSGVTIEKSFAGGGDGNSTARIYGTDSGIAETGIRIGVKGTGGFSAVDSYILQGLNNGTTRFVFNSSGNLGIGTNNPNNRQLSVYGSGFNGTQIECRSTSGSSSGLSMYAGRNFEIQSTASNEANYPSSFLVYDRDANGYRMAIDGSGRLQIPSQPGFCASGTAGAANQPSSSSEDMLGTLFNTTSHTGGFNTGNHYNTGTGIFTAPVAGKYYTFFNMRWETANFVQTSYIRIFISKNNINTLLIHQINGQNEAWSNYMAMSCSGIIDLAAGDTLRPKGGLNGGTAVGWWNESSWGAWLLG